MGTIKEGEVTGRKFHESTGKKMCQEKKSQELYVTKIQKTRFCGNLKSRTAMGEENLTEVFLGLFRVKQ